MKNEKSEKLKEWKMGKERKNERSSGAKYRIGQKE